MNFFKHQTVQLKALLFFFYSSMMIIISYLPVYFQEAGYTGRQIGILLAVGPMAAIFAQPFWGYMTDKFKTSKRVITFCMVGAIALSFALFSQPTYQLLIIITFFFFSFMSPISGLCDSLAQKTATRTSVSFGTIRMWGSIGFAVMSLVSGFLLSRIGIRYIYIPYLFFISIALVISILIKDTEASSQKPVNLKQAFNLVRNKKFVLFLALIIFITITHRTSDTFIGIFILERGGAETIIGWSWFIGVASEAFVFATATIWFRKYHELTFIIIAAVLYSIRWYLMSILQEPLLILPLQVLHGLTFGVFYLCAFSFVTKQVPKELQSTGHLLFYTVFFGISGVFGSIVGGNIIEASSASYLYYYLFFSSLIGVLCLTIYKTVFFRNAGLGQINQ
ncbi:MAG: MFS transporter [Bacillaceae bacterium]|nr:MFS transporter [Bacillaceae bacterium]